MSSWFFALTVIEGSNHGVILTEEFEKHNVKLESVTEDIDNTELGKLIVYVKGFAAKLEAEKFESGA